MTNVSFHPLLFKREETPVRRLLQFVSLVAVMSAMAGRAIAADESQQVRIEKDAKNELVNVFVGDQELTVYNLGKQWPKPFASPVYGPNGTVMTRSIAKPGEKKIDHAHHKGIWVAVDEVNDIKFWAEKGKIENVSAKVLKAKGNPAQLQLVNHWLGEDGKPILEESTTISIFANGLMAYDIHFKALNNPVTFGDTKEGLLGFRMVDSMKESETGHVVNSEGQKGTREAWGKTAHWVDYSGMIEGKTLGVALFDNPENFRPSRYHVRNYGLFSISPFGEQAYAKQGAKPVTLKPGETLRLRYGIYIHAGDTQAAHVAKVYQEYVQYSK